jgi:hypothetical protein
MLPPLDPPSSRAGRPATVRQAGMVAAIVLVMFAVYWGSAALLGRRGSPVNSYFDELADSFLHGHLYLLAPTETLDLTFHDGRWYVPFLPLPAVLLLPWVAVSGVLHASTVAFGAAIGALNTALAFCVLQSLARRGWTHLRWSDDLWLTALWGLGSVHWYMSTLGSVWFLSQLCTATFALLAVLLAVTTASPLLSGSALAVAMWGRPNILFTLPLLVAIGVEHTRLQSASGDWRAGLRWGLVALAPPLLSAIALLVYNAARFGSPLDFGYAAQNVADELAGDLGTYGLFSLHYVRRNLWTMLFATPVVDARTSTILPSGDGMSVLLTTPALMYAFRARPRTALVAGAWLSVGLLLIPLLTYYNTGWTQFGYRFSLDVMTPLLVLVAVGAGARVGWVMRTLILIGIAINAWGTWWYLNPRFFS